MFASMYTSLSASLMQERRLDVISNNLANVNTTGFKKDHPVFESFLMREERRENAVVGGGTSEYAANTPDMIAYMNKGTMNVPVGTSKERIPNENVFVKTSQIATNFEQGSLKPTGNELDIAIEGSGFFGFKTESGTMYGRNGALHLNAKGQMVSSEGYPLLDSDGNPIVTDLNLYTNISFKKDGEILASTSTGQSVSLGFIKVSEFEKPENLEKVGASLFRNNNNAAEERNSVLSKSKVVQGVIEQSNVNVVREMTDMIEANRGYTTMQKVIQSIDGINQKLIQEVGRPV